MNALILHIPHASMVIPKAVQASFALSPESLVRELLLMTDHDTDVLFGAAALPSDAVVQAQVSRLVVDVERFVDDAQEEMAAVGMGVIYTSRHDGLLLRPVPDDVTRQRLLQQYYWPHHRALSAAVAADLARHGAAWVLDCHSFPRQPLPYEFDQSFERPDFCIGTNDFHTPDALAVQVEALLASRGHSVQRNAPFAGCLLPAEYYQRDVRVHGLMLEVNRGLYMDEGSGAQLPKTFPRIQALLAEVVALVRGFAQ